MMVVTSAYVTWELYMFLIKTAEEVNQYWNAWGSFMCKCKMFWVYICWIGIYWNPLISWRQYCFMVGGCRSSLLTISRRKWTVIWFTFPSGSRVMTIRFLNFKWLDTQVLSAKATESVWKARKARHANFNRDNK